MKKSTKFILSAIVVAAVAVGLWMTQPEECRKLSETTSPYCVD